MQANTGTDSGPRKDSLRDGGQMGSSPAVLLSPNTNNGFCQCEDGRGQKGPVCLS